MKTSTEMIEHYKRMHSISPGYSSLREVREQYIDMATGGDGGKLYGIEGEPTCREYNYPGYPTSFFQEVCKGMGWLF